MAAGHKVIGIDNFSSGKPSNLHEISGYPSFLLLTLDVAKPSILHQEELQGIEEIYHLASPASPRDYQRNPFATIAANTAGTSHMLELAAKNGAKLVYASTSEAYGDPEVHPQPEEYKGNVNTWGPRACYDESKRLGEVYCYEYHRQIQLPVKVARIFNTYSGGLRNDDGRVISNFVTQALNGEDITVYGNGSQTRSFCYVTDTIRGLITLMEKDAANGQIINIGNDTEYSILDIAHLVKELTGSSSRITFHPLPQDDPQLRRPCLTKARTLLGWEPVVTLREGLLRTIEAYCSQMGR